MAAGIKVRNRHGTIQIGQDYSNFALDGGRKNFSVIARPTGFLHNSDPPSGTTADSIIVSDNLYDQPYYGWNWGYCWVFKPADKVSVSGVAGKRVRNPKTGKVVFDSSHRYLRIVDYVRTGTNVTRTYPADRKYRVAPLAWRGLDIIKDAGWDQWVGNLYTQSFRSMKYQISNNTLMITQLNESDGEIFDGPPGLAGQVGSDPYIELLVVDMTGYPGVA